MIAMAMRHTARTAATTDPRIIPVRAAGLSSTLVEVLVGEVVFVIVSELDSVGKLDERGEEVVVKLVEVDVVVVDEVEPLELAVVVTV